MVPLFEDSSKALFIAPKYLSEKRLSFLVEWSTELLHGICGIRAKAVGRRFILIFKDIHRVLRDRVYEQLQLLMLDVHKVRELL